MHTTEGAVLRLAGSITLQTVNEAHQMMIGAWSDQQSIVLDLTEVEEADLTLIQLVESARGTAAAEGKTLTLSAPPSEAVMETLVRGGFVADSRCERTPFWLGR